MKLNEPLKSFSLKNVGTFLILFIIINYSNRVTGAQKEDPIDKTNYVIHVYLRKYCDKKNGKYDKESEFNLSGFNDNARWDAIFMLTQFVEKRSKIWWFNNNDNPLSIVIKFPNKDKAQSCYNELEKRDYGSSIRGLKLEKFIHHFRPLQKISS